MATLFYVVSDETNTTEYLGFQGVSRPITQIVLRKLI